MVHCLCEVGGGVWKVELKSPCVLGMWCQRILIFLCWQWELWKILYNHVLVFLETSPHPEDT